MKIIFNHDNGFNHEGRVFCEVNCIPDNESDDELLNLGWLPSLEDNGFWYQSRSCRLNTSNFNISSKRKNLLNKLEIKITEYKNDFLIDSFFKDYYLKNNFDIFDLYNNCSNFFKISVAKIYFDNEIVAYGRFTERNDSNIFLNLAYNKKLSKLSLGTNLFFILSEYTKNQNKKYLYLYECYKNTYDYKQNFTGIEIWNGINWIQNKK